MKTEIRYAIIFTAVTLVISWTVTIILFRYPENIGIFPFIMLIPATVGIILNIIRYRSLKQVIKPLTNRINIRSVLFALLYPVIFLVVTAVLVLLTGAGNLNTDNLPGLSLYPALGTIAFGLFLTFGEEYGWRGFLLKNLADAKGKIFAAVITGVVWAAWHGPVVYELATYTKMENPVLVMIIQMGAVFVFSFPFAYSYFL
jgi:membrane protease YdiL (CAAX protease family)